MAEAKLKVVNPWHLLTEDGSFPEEPAVRAQAIRVAQCIEYGGNLGRGYSRETLIQCRRRPDGAACPGLLHVLKQDNDAIHVFCACCEADEYLIYEWEDTLWADGLMEPLNVAELAKAHEAEPREPVARDPDELLTSTKIGANAPCHCGSGKKYERCCMSKQSFN